METISETIAWIVLLIILGAPVLSGIVQIIREEKPVNLEPDNDEEEDE